ncbi:MAG: AAA family ATPase [Candidatus Gracilibacteria bacterium]|nr:AAA family ATPase [Candidatus Gracilibacteria bacterium]
MPKNITVGTQDFKKFIEDGCYYVDKTKQLHKLVSSTNGYYFLSRPRRFGKSLTLSMMKYLYLGKKELFKGLYIENKWDFEKTNPVIYMSFAGYTVDQNIEEYIDDNFKIFIDDEIFKLSNFSGKYNLGLILNKVYEKTNKKTAVIVDEYDKAVLVNITNVDEAEKMRAFFTSFYSGVKDSDDKIEIFMLTGLTKILKMSVFSVLNNLMDLSFNPISYDLMGYTWHEVKNNFGEEIEILQKKYNFTDEEVKTKITNYYNGFNFGNSEDTIFNPWNINNLFISFEFSYFWADTGIPSAILNYIDKNRINIVDLVEKIKSNKLKLKEVHYKLEDLNHINVAVLFANAGYLTIKKSEHNTYTLGFPNKETESVMLDFLALP